MGHNNEDKLYVALFGYNKVQKTASVKNAPVLARTRVGEIYFINLQCPIISKLILLKHRQNFSYVVVI